MQFISIVDAVLNHQDIPIPLQGLRTHCPSTWGLLSVADHISLQELQVYGRHPTLQWQPMTVQCGCTEATPPHLTWRKKSQTSFKAPFRAGWGLRYSSTQAQHLPRCDLRASPRTGVDPENTTQRISAHKSHNLPLGNSTEGIYEQRRTLCRSVTIDGEGDNECSLKRWRNRWVNFFIFCRFGWPLSFGSLNVDYC